MDTAAATTTTTINNSIVHINSFNFQLACSTFFLSISRLSLSTDPLTH